MASNCDIIDNLTFPLKKIIIKPQIPDLNSYPNQTTGTTSCMFARSGSNCMSFGDLVTDRSNLERTEKMSETQERNVSTIDKTVLCETTNTTNNEFLDGVSVVNTPVMLLCSDEGMEMNNSNLHFPVPPFPLLLMYPQSLPVNYCTNSYPPIKLNPNAEVQNVLNPCALSFSMPEYSLIPLVDENPTTYKNLSTSITENEVFGHSSSEDGGNLSISPSHRPNGFQTMPFLQITPK